MRKGAGEHLALVREQQVLPRGVGVGVVLRSPQLVRLQTARAGHAGFSRRIC